MMHPAIESAVQTGYPYSEPQVYSSCTRCNEEIHYKEEFIDHGGYDYCSKECLVEQMLEDGNASLEIAE